MLRSISKRAFTHSKTSCLSTSNRVANLNGYFFKENLNFQSAQKRFNSTAKVPEPPLKNLDNKPIHPSQKDVPEEDYLLMHPVYTEEYVLSIKPKHLVPEKWQQKVAFHLINMIRAIFDKATGYPKNMTEAKWLQRMIFLETVAGVPGMVSGSLRHLQSLRSMNRDNGWIHTLLEEAENERMHLLTFLQLKQPTGLFRFMVIVTQGIVYNLYFLSYLISPKICHSFVTCY